MPQISPADLYMMQQEIAFAVATILCPVMLDASV